MLTPSTSCGYKGLSQMDLLSAVPLSSPPHSNFVWFGQRTVNRTITHASSALYFPAALRHENAPRFGHGAAGLAGATLLEAQPPAGWRQPGWALAPLGAEDLLCWGLHRSGPEEGNLPTPELPPGGLDPVLSGWVPTSLLGLLPEPVAHGVLGLITDGARQLTPPRWPENKPEPLKPAARRDP